MSWAGRLYLSLEAQVQLRITDRYSIHRVIQELFEYQKKETQSDSSGFQWVDKGTTIYGRRIDFLSDLPINIRPLMEGVSLELKELPSFFLDKDKYRFQILMNTCRCRENVRIAITKEDDIVEWFEAKAATRGMLTHVAQVDQRGVDYFYKGKRRLVFSHARLSGFLKVEDREKFKSAFHTGRGKGRAFGFGFLQLASC